MQSQVVLRWKCWDEFSWDLSWVIFGCDYFLSDNYGERHEVLTGINRVDIVPYQQSPTFKLDKSHKKAHIKRAFFYIEQII